MKKIEKIKNLNPSLYSASDAEDIRDVQAMIADTKGALSDSQLIAEIGEEEIDEILAFKPTASSNSKPAAKAKTPAKSKQSKPLTKKQDDNLVACRLLLEKNRNKRAEEKLKGQKNKKLAELKQKKLPVAKHKAEKQKIENMTAGDFKKKTSLKEKVKNKAKSLIKDITGQRALTFGKQGKLLTKEAQADYETRLKADAEAVQKFASDRAKKTYDYIDTKYISKAKK